MRLLERFCCCSIASIAIDGWCDRRCTSQMSNAKEDSTTTSTAFKRQPATQLPVPAGSLLGMNRWHDLEGPG